MHTLIALCVRSEKESNTRQKVLPRAPFPLRHRASEGCRAEGAMDSLAFSFFGDSVMISNQLTVWSGQSSWKLSLEFVFTSPEAEESLG